jgi:hypothetical protein
MLKWKTITLTGISTMASKTKANFLRQLRRKNKKSFEHFGVYYCAKCESQVHGHELNRAGICSKCIRDALAIARGL